MTRRALRHLAARQPEAADEAFLEALYLASRPDLGALPVPASVIAGIARHQRQLQLADYAQRFPALETWIVLEGTSPVGRLVLDRSGAALRVVDLSVAPAARRRGIARTVLQALQDEGRAMLLRVRAGNAAARALYAGLGFSPVRDDGAALELGWLKRQNE